MGKVAKALIVAALALPLTILAGKAFVRWSLKDLQFDLSGLAAQVNADTAVIRALVGRNCFRTVDQSSIGDKRKEAQMSYVAAVLDLYRVRFGKSTAVVSELNKLPEFEHANSTNRHYFEKDCSIHVGESGSAVVSCGSSRPTKDTVEAFMRNAKPVQKFYLLDGSEILFIPAPKC